MWNKENTHYIYIYIYILIKIDQVYIKGLQKP